MNRILKLAGILSENLVWDKRLDGTDFVKRADGAPEWIKDVCIAVTGSDDWAYQFMYKAAQVIADCEDDDENEDEIRERLYEIESDIYTVDLLDWMKQHYGYVDDAMDSFRPGAFKGIMEWISAGQHEHIQEVARALYDELAELAGDDDWYDEIFPAFKVGDRVRATDDLLSYLLDELYSVSEGEQGIVTEYGSWNSVNVQWDSAPGDGTFNVIASELELVTPVEDAP